jgi:hypothetical protein
MNWVTLKARLVVGKVFQCTIEQIAGSLPWRWTVINIAPASSRWPLAGGFSRSELGAKRAAVDHARKELRISKGKKRVLDAVEREWLALAGLDDEASP